MKKLLNILLLGASLSLTVSGQPDPLSLSGAIEIAMEKNYGITISRAEKEITGISNDWGAAGRYPGIGFDAALNNTYELSDPALSTSATAGIGVNWVLFDGFRVNITKTKLEDYEDLASGQLGVVIENTIEDVILAYYGVLLQEERLEVLRSVVNLSRDRFVYEQKRRSLGGSFTYDVLQAENVYLADSATFLEQEMIVRNSIRSLNYLLTAEPDLPRELSGIFEADTMHYILADLHQKMMSDNQTIKNQYTRLRLKQQDVELSKADYYPSVSLSSGMDSRLGWTMQDGTTIRTNSLGPYGNIRLSFDIYQGGARDRAKKIAQIQEGIAETEIESLEKSLINELYSLYDTYEVRIALLRVADRNLAAAKLNLELSEEKYRTGAINSFNYRDVQLIYMEASFLRLQAIYNLVAAHTQLSRITGGFLSGEGTTH